MVEKPEGRSVGRPKYRCEDNIKNGSLGSGLRHKLYRRDPELVQVAFCSECDNEGSVYIKCGGIS
jgi:hypothetical protein